MTTSNEHNNAPAVPQGWTDADSDSARLALELECLLLDTKDLSVVSKWWASANEALELHRQRLAATPAPAPAQDEPFGYFRAEPFGWTDCAKDDEGAIALYERPQDVGLTDEEIKPDARLLAAAPELLDSLRALTHSLDPDHFEHDDQREAFKQAVAAITKATGATHD